MSLNLRVYKKLYHYDLDVEFDLNDEILAIVGESGSGKSMLLKNIAGIEIPDSGYIYCNNRCFFDSKEKKNLDIRLRKVGFLFQNYALFPHLSVLDNLKIIFNRDNIDYGYILNLLKIFKVDHLLNMKPSEISGGEKQRVALARMICSNPDIILMDEPFSALDTNLKWSIESELTCFLKEYNKTVVFVTHNMDEAMRMSNKVLLLNNGKIIDYGLKNDVLIPKNIESAKLLGFKNIYSISEFFHLISKQKLSRITEKYGTKEYKYIIVDSKKFSLNNEEGSDNLIILLKLKYITEDSNYYIIVFNSLFDETKLVTVEVSKTKFNYSKLKKLVNNSEIKVYYSIRDLILI